MGLFGKHKQGSGKEKTAGAQSPAVDVYMSPRDVKLSEINASAATLAEFVCFSHRAGYSIGDIALSAGRPESEVQEIVEEAKAEKSYDWYANKVKVDLD